MKKNYKSVWFYIGATIIPMIIMLFIYIIKGICPFGKNTFLSADMLGQYVQFLTELSDKIKNGESLLYTWSRGLGQNYIAESAYYVSSPLNVILLFFNAKQIPSVINIMIIIRCGIAALCMYIYLKKHYSSVVKINNNEFGYMVFAIAYGLCSYMVKYYQNVMWLDGFMLFPLAILGLELLVTKNSKRLYVIALSYVIFSNYYIGFMTCIFCVIYFIYMLLLNYKEVNVKRTILRFLCSSLISGALCAVILIPMAWGLSNTQAKSVSFYSTVTTYYDFYISLYRMMFRATPTFPSNPNLFFSDIIFVLGPLYIFSDRIPKKEKAMKLCIMIFLLLSFRIPILAYLWNGMHQTNGLSGRNSFMFIFLGITVCTDVLCHGYKYNRKNVLLTGLFLLINMLLINMQMPYRVTWHSIVINSLIIFVYAVLILKRANIYLICSLVICEVITSSYLSVRYTGITIQEYCNRYDKGKKIIESIEDDGFYRIKNDEADYSNEASLLKYKSLSIYSSNANDKLGDFLYDLGYYTSLNKISDVSEEPIFMNVLGEKYIIVSKDNSITPGMKKYRSTQNADIYINKNALSVAFEVPLKTYKCKYSGENPFERINDFAQTLDSSAELYKKLDGDLLNKTIHINKGDNLFIYSGDINGENCFKFDNKKEKLLSSKGVLGDVFEKGKESKYIYNIKNSHKGGILDLTKTKDGSSLVYKLNEEQYMKVMDKLEECQLNVTKYTEREIQGDVSCNYDGIMMTSIPYDDGWKVTVDGKNVKNLSIKNALLCFEIGKGRHNVKMIYCPKGLFEGGCISFITSVIAIMWYLMGKSVKKKK